MAFGFKAEVAPAPRQSLSLRGPNGHRPRLLLAEDSDPVRVVTAAMLKGMGCDVDAVVHGEEAVKSATASRFDVIVLDIEMPIMDGITAARSIRKLGGSTSATPIMALSAFLADAMRTASWSETFDIALPKPANRNELHAAVEAALNWQARKVERLAIDQAPILSPEQLTVLCSGIDRAVLRGLIDIACRDIIDNLEKVSSSSAANADVRKTHAHKLRALGRTFAAPRLALLAMEIERLPPSVNAAELISSLSLAADLTIEALRSV